MTLTGKFVRDGFIFKGKVENLTKKVDYEIDFGDFHRLDDFAEEQRKFYREFKEKYSNFGPAIHAIEELSEKMQALDRKFNGYLDDLDDLN